MNSPRVSVVMPAYNTAQYIETAVQSVLAQTYTNFELLIIDDEGTDDAIDLCRKYSDPRLRIISQKNRGLAGARNTGIRRATGEYIAFLDSDDVWESEKLSQHVAHLEAKPAIGVSYAASSMMDDDGTPLRIVQRPKLRNITAKDVFLRNPIGNGSAPVIRKAVFDDIAFVSPTRNELDYFDETFRQSEDIECWCRIALTTDWNFEGIEGVHTRYRINEGGLSANVIRQFETWTRVRDRVRHIDPVFAETFGKLAEAYQLRYLSRRCIRMGDGAMAWSLIRHALATKPQIALHEPAKTLTTYIAAVTLRFLPSAFNTHLQATIQRG